MYIHRSAISVFSVFVHEGTHAYEHYHDIPQFKISSHKGEYRAYVNEHDYQVKSGEHNAYSISQTPSAKFPLSWSHYLLLKNSHWSLRELKRQFGSSLYERLALSRDKNKVKELSELEAF